RSAGTHLRKLYVEPTNRCNIQCAMCVRHSWEDAQGDMPFDVFKAILDQARGLPAFQTIQFGGFGEPLLHPDLFSMIRAASEAGVRTELLTNALLLDERLCREAVQSGLTSLTVSLDGLSSSTYGAIRDGADVKAVIRNVRTLGTARWQLGSRTPEIGLEFVAMKRNVHELPELRTLAVSLGASSILVTNLLPYTADLKHEVLYGCFTPTATVPVSPRLNPAVNLPKMDVNEFTQRPVAELLRTVPNLSILGTLLPTNETRRRFVSEGCAAIAWDCGLSPCLPLMHTYRCYVLGREKRIRRWVVGQLPAQSLAELWQSEPYAAFRQRVRDFDFSPCTDCGGCEMVGSNEEDCFGNTHPVCGDCLWARGVVQCP
ncbi:MAG: radical SAM protein, partial [Planctomycetes bacterium]|nr:radical SAM protein [Planctomycetota bacterium]